jgi:alpha-galactosidase
MAVRPPVFEVDRRPVRGTVKQFRSLPARQLRNGAVEQAFEGRLIADPALKLVVRFRSAHDSPVVRFRYELRSTGASRPLTKSSGADAFTYITASAANLPHRKEVRLSEFDERAHATTLTEVHVADRMVENSGSAMGPILVLGNGQANFLLAYEHGSQFPERFLEYRFTPDREVRLSAVKGNYLHNQQVTPAAPYKTVWFEVAGVSGSEDALAQQYRDFVLRYLSENRESRKPYIFYNTWGRQERVKWGGGKYLDSMNLATTLAEIDVAHRMGVEVFVLDTGWYEKTGDWRVSKERFPDQLKQVKTKLGRYGMKLGLWFNPTAAALSSRMLARNSANAMMSGGQKLPANPIWETEESQPLSLVSPYWRDFAAELIRLNRELGVTYFKWDAVDQHGSDAAGHYHGGPENSRSERADAYAFQLPIYLSKIADEVSKAVPGAIVDFDVTEPGRAVGLQFLSSGKYFLINNGPYFHNFDLAPPWESPLPNGNANIFVNPGPARTWFARSALRYDRWIPSVLFLTHYQPDEPRSSQILNLASLILGQNGIWGEIMKTSPEGVAYIGEVISKYKQVRYDITAAFPITEGQPGAGLEVHEKINSKTSKGAVVLFANARGRYTFVSENAVHPLAWHTGGPLQLRRDGKGRAVIEAEFAEPGARVLFFGAR